MRIFWAADWMDKQASDLLLAHNIRPGNQQLESGYQVVNRQLRQIITEMGCQITDDPDDADAEIYGGPIFQKNRPHLRPALIYTMVEYKGQLTKTEIECLNNYDVVLTPSLFSLEELTRCDIKPPVFYAPHWIDFDKYTYRERNFDGDFEILVQGSWVFDRKNVWVIFAFLSKYKDKLPGDMRFILKTSSGITDLELSLPNLKIVQGILPDDEYTRLMETPILSLYLSSGEGFGLMPAEHAAQGMAVAMMRNSSLATEFLDKCSSFIEIPGVRGKPIYNLYHSMMLPDIDGLFDLLMKLYEDRDSLKRRARGCYNYVKETFSYDRVSPIWKRCISVLTILPRKKVDRSDNLFDYFLGDYRLLQEESFNELLSHYPRF